MHASLPSNDATRRPDPRPGRATATRPRLMPRLCGAVLVLAGVAPAVDACSPRDPTPAAAPGPHDFSSAPENATLWREGDRGEPLALSLRVLDTCGNPVAGAVVHLLHADADGAHVPGRFRAILATDARGAVDVLTVIPGYAGDLARHIHFIIRHPAHDDLVTRLYFKNDPALAGRADDPLALVPEAVHHGGGTRWVSGYEFVLSPVRR